MKKSNAQIPEGQKNIYKELIKMEPLKTELATSSLRGCN